MPKDTSTCVYIHTRVLDNVVFYIGIGRLARPYETTRRNQHWRRLVAKYAYSITLIHTDLSWEDACRIEIELIQKYREISGDNLCNMTAGGEGAKGRVFSDETRMKLSVISKNRPPEANARIAAAAKNRTPEAKAKMGAGKKGKVVSEETRAKICAARASRVTTEESRLKMKASQQVRRAYEADKALW